MDLGDLFSDIGADDILDFGLKLFNYDQQKDAARDSRKAVEQGFAMQNPWAKNQPAMGDALMSLLQDPSRITETPGYQFAYDQGLEALMAKQAATGNRFSGRALTETMQFGQGLASQMYNQELNRYAQLAGATQATSGGIQTGENLSSIANQNAFNDAYFWQQLFGPLTNRTTSPTSQGTRINGGYGDGTWASP